MKSTHQRLSLVIASAAALLLCGARPAQAGEPITVARIKVTASLVCADGREAQLAHIALSVPQGTAAVTFSRPEPGDDPYSVWWLTANPCSHTHAGTVRMELRNITTTGFIATIEPLDLPSSRAASEHQRVVVRVGDTATLTIRSEVLGTERFTGWAEAVKAALAATPVVDAKDDVPSKFGGVGLARSWLSAGGGH